MAYQKQEWHDLPLEDTPISASRLNHMEDGIFEAYEHGGGESIPIGGIMSFGGSIEPTGWLFCNGQAVSRTNYAELFEAIGTAFGEGDGSTTFNVPNFSSRSPMGVGTGTDQNGDTMVTELGMDYGEYQHTLTVEEMPSHNHSSQGYAKVVDSGSFYALITNGSDTSKTTRSTGGGEAHNIIHPILGVNFIIKATEVTPNQSNVINQRSNSTIDTYSCDYINKLNTYSTEETVIGTWMDKTLYRKEFDITDDAPSGISANTQIVLDSIPTSFVSDIDMIPNARISRTGENNLVFWGLNYVQKITAQNKIQMQSNVSLGLTSPQRYILTLEYTKTTD